MDVSSIGRNRSQTDQDPLLMEHETHNNREHIVDITSNDEDSSSRSSIDELTPDVGEERMSSNGTQHPTHPSPSSPPRQRATSSRRGDDGNGRRSSSRSPLNSGFWISVELVVTVAQIIAAIVVMVLAKDEHPEAPLFTWVVGYTSGCIATLPILYWRFRTYNRGTGQDSSQRSSSSQGSSNPSESTPYTAVSVAQAPDEENSTDMRAAPRMNNEVGESLRTR